MIQAVNAAKSPEETGQRDLPHPGLAIARTVNKINIFLSIVFSLGIFFSFFIATENILRERSELDERVFCS